MLFASKCTTTGFVMVSCHLVSHTVPPCSNSAWKVSLGPELYVRRVFLMNDCDELISWWLDF